MTDPSSGSPAPAPAAAEARGAGRPAWALVGALLLLVLGLAMLVPAVHLATEPILLPTAAGPPFDCGTALKPPTKPFPVQVCGAEPRREQQRAAAWAVAAVIVGLGGVLAFLVPTRGRGRGSGHTRRRSASDASDVPTA